MMDKPKNKKGKCVVITDKKSMLVYELLYIIGLIMVSIGGLLQYLRGGDYLLGSVVIASVMFAIATIIWAFDRKCINIDEIKLP